MTSRSREPRSTGNLNLYLGGGTSTLHPRLCMENKPHPAEAGISKSVGLINGRLKRRPLVFRLARSCVTSLSFGQVNPFSGRVSSFLFAWLLVQDTPPHPHPCPFFFFRPPLAQSHQDHLHQYQTGQDLLYLSLSSCF